LRADENEARRIIVFLKNQTLLPFVDLDRHWAPVGNQSVNHASKTVTCFPGNFPCRCSRSAWLICPAPMLSWSAS